MFIIIISLNKKDDKMMWKNMYVTIHCMHNLKISLTFQHVDLCPCSNGHPRIGNKKKKLSSFRMK